MRDDSGGVLVLTGERRRERHSHQVGLAFAVECPLPLSVRRPSELASYPQASRLETREASRKLDGWVQHRAARCRVLRWKPGSLDVPCGTCAGFAYATQRMAPAAR